MTVNHPEQDELPIDIDPRRQEPISLQLREQLTWLIATRALEVGDRLPSIRRLAAQVGVHHHTVRAAYRLLEDDALISVRHGAGATVRPFSTRQVARLSPGGLPTHIGVLVAGYDPFYLPFLDAIETRMSADRALTTICVAGDSPLKARIQIDQLLAHGVAGIIAGSIGQLIQHEMETGSRPAPIPIVYCDQPDIGAAHSIIFDAPAAGYQIAAHLRAHGHRRLVVVTPSLDYPNVAALHSGLARAVSDGVVSRVDPVLAGDWTVAAGVEAGRDLLSKRRRPRCIVTVADRLAIGLLQAAHQVRLRVPEDVALVSYGEIEGAELLEPPLTTVRLPSQEMGRAAADLLSRLMRGDQLPPETMVLPAELVVRRSCGCGG